MEIEDTQWPEPAEEYALQKYAEDEWQLRDSYGDQPMEYHLEHDDISGLEIASNAQHILP